MKSNTVIASSIAQVENLEAGESALIRGVLMEPRAQHGSPSGFPVSTTSWYDIDTTGGTFTVSFRTVTLRYGQSDVDGYAGKPVALGDTVSVVVTKTLAGTLSAGKTKPRLIELSQQRRDQYEAERDDVHEQLLRLNRAVTVGQFQHARGLFAHLRRQALTQDERAEMQFHVRRLPLRERPLYERSGSVFAAYFDTRVEMLNADEFVQFAHGVLADARMAGDAAAAAKLASDTYALLDDERFTVLEKYEVAAHAINAHLKTAWPDLGFWALPTAATEIVRASVQFLGSLDGEDTFATLTILGDECVKEGLFDQEGDLREPVQKDVPSFLADVLRALTEHMLRRRCLFVRMARRAELWEEQLVANHCRAGDLYRVQQLIPGHPSVIKN